MNHVNEIQLNPRKQRDSNTLGPEERHVILKLGWDGEKEKSSNDLLLCFLLEKILY